MTIGKRVGRTTLIGAFHCPQFLPTSQSFKRRPLSPTLYPWAPRIKDMTYCLPGVSLKQKQEAVKKIRVAGIGGGTMEEIHQCSCVGNWASKEVEGLTCPQAGSPNSLWEAEPSIPGLRLPAQPLLPPCEPFYSLWNGTNGSSPNRASCFSSWITA